MQKTSGNYGNIEIGREFRTITSIKVSLLNTEEGGIVLSHTYTSSNDPRRTTAFYPFGGNMDAALDLKALIEASK